MMTPNNKPTTGKDETQTSLRKTAASARPPQEPALNCPRCDSSNTKFCYYNNYSLTQPRHFCKTCRRYWTRGGALRNVPIGGGCRKTRKIKSSPRFSGESKDSSGSSDIGGLKFFQGISPAMDFQLGAINLPKLFPNTGLLNQFTSLDNLSNTCRAISSNPCINLDPSAGSSSSPMGLNFNNMTAEFQEMGSLNCRNGLTSSIESLSSINQDLHWKLQRQRLAMLFVGDNNNNNNQKDYNYNIPSVETPVHQNLHPTSFQNMDIKKNPESCGDVGKDDGACGNIISNGWFFGNSYATVIPTPATSGSNLNENTSNWSGFQDLY